MSLICCNHVNSMWPLVPLALALVVPTGSYEKTLAFPFLGKQEIVLTIKNKRTAQLSLAGLINHDENVTYKLHPNGNVEFTISQSLTDILSRYRTRISNTWFDDITEEACLDIRILPLHFNKKIRLKRNKQRTHESLKTTFKEPTRSFGESLFWW